MALKQPNPLPQKDETPHYEGGLSRSLVRTLLIFTFIPLILMAGATYYRARSLLRDQVVEDMQLMLSNQLGRVDLNVKTKQIRLDRISGGPARTQELEAALQSGPSSSTFISLRDRLTRELRSVTADTGRPTFSQYILLGTDGTILMTSNSAWQGQSLQNSPYFASLMNSDDSSFALYDLAPLYPKELVLATVSKLKTGSGAPLGVLVGITEPQELQSTLTGLVALSPDSEALYVTSDGTVITSDAYTNQMAVYALPQEQQTILTGALQHARDTGQGKPEDVTFVDDSGARSFGQIEWMDSIHAGVVYEIHEQTIFGPLNSLIPFTIILFVGTLAAMGIVLSLGSQRVFRPLVELAEISRRFADGDFSQRAEARSKDEIGMLAHSFNQMAEQLSELYRSLEQKVQERTRQIHTAAEVAQRITSTAKLDELLNRTVQLIVDQFGFYQASIFMLDQRGRYAVLQAAYGPAAREMLSRGHRLEVGSASIIGWVTANRQPRVASDVSADPVHFKNELLPQTRSEVGIPITVGNLVLGALDVQSASPEAFGPDTVVMLQLIASQIAVAIQNVGLVQSTQVNFQDLERLQRSSREIIAAHTKEDALQALTRVLADAPYSTLVLAVEDHELAIRSQSEEGGPQTVRVHTGVKMLEERLDEVSRALTLGPIIGETDSPNMPPALAQFARQLGFQAVSFIPVLTSDSLSALVAMGAQGRTLNAAAMQPYVNLADMAGITLERLAETEAQRRRLAERESLSVISQTIAESSADFAHFFEELHAQVQRNIGDYAFIVALFDKSTQSISIPYMYEEGHTDHVDAFPLGEGLSSILIRSSKPLLLVEDVERRAAELGAKTLGKPARSWMGAPMLIQGEPIGALIVQDLEHERAFDDDNLKFFVALANQVAAVIHNARLLDESRARTLQLETAAEIARDVSGSLNLDELLAKAVGYIRERYDFYHASIFLMDPAGEHAVIREATGEAGAQMKRVGHKLSVGSKSIVGYVAGQGEPLVVNDTAKDATYYANPLLPATQSEAALPLKVGERIVGVMDVQSTHPYAFGADSLRSLRILADQLAVAVVNSELFAETQEHLSQHRLLHHITTSAASGTTLEEALESAVTGLQVTLGGDRVAIMLMDPEKKTLEVKAQAGYSEDIMNLRVAVGTGITGWVAQHHRPLRIDNVAEDPRYIRASANTVSELALPLMYRNEALGVLNVESEQVGAYTQDDEEMLGTLGGSLAAVIANARLIEQIRGQAERERLIYDITSKIRRSTNMEAVLATTASELTRALGARRAHIRIAGPQQGGDNGKGRKDGQS